MLIIDTRERKNDHIKSFLDNHNIKYQVKKLDVGDYAEEDGHIVIDRKKDLNELVVNMVSKDRTRFYNEIRRARKNKVKMIILCEHGGKVKTISDVKDWNPKYSKVSGQVLMNKMYEAHIAYGIEFLFCDKRTTGRKICELLGVDYE